MYDARASIKQTGGEQAVNHFTDNRIALLFVGVTHHHGDSKGETTMKTIVHLVLAATVLLGAASSAFAGRDPETGEDRYPALADQADAHEAAKYRAGR